MSENEEAPAPAAEESAPAEAAPASEEAASDKPKIVGKWVVDRNENFEKFLEANGANWFVRQMANMSKPNVEITQDGEEFNIKLLSTFVNREEKFKIGEEYEQKQHNGAITKAMPVWEGEKLVITYTPPEGEDAKAQKATREVNEDGELVLTMEVDDVVAKRFFKKKVT